MSDPEIPAANKAQLLSEKNYPKLFEAVQQLRETIQKDFPGDTLPDIYVVQTKEKNVSYVRDLEKGSTISNYSHVVDGAVIDVPLKGTEKEAVILTTGAIEALGISGTVATIAHEFGHDIGNHGINTETSTLSPWQQRNLATINEYQADQFAVKYISPEVLAKALDAADPDRNPATQSALQREERSADYHPPTDSRIRALLDPVDPTLVEQYRPSPTPRNPGSTQKHRTR
jgi:Zn-dependent protease with chaperone function